MVGARRRTITAALLVGTFLASIEVTVVAAAMPSIVSQLGGLALYPWVFSAYLLCQTITIPLYGRLADLHGRRRTYVVGISIFLVGSLLCGLAPTMTWLVAARAIQGLGAGSVLPLTMTIFGDLYEVSARTKMQGLFSLVWGVSSLVGPLAGGAIVQHWTWPWIFLINLPFGLISSITIGLLLREPERRREHRLDLGGAGLLTVASLVLLLGLLPAQQRPLDLPLVVWLGAALLFMLLFLRTEYRHPEPLVPLDLFRDRVHIAANGSGVLLGVVLFGFVSYVPLYVQKVLGGSPVMAGAVIIPVSVGWTTATFIGGRLVKRVGFRLLVRVGCTSVALGGILALLGLRESSATIAILGAVVYGLGMGFTISSFTVAAQVREPHHRRGIATALTQFSRSIGGAVGVAMLGAMLAHALGPVASGAMENLAPAVLGQGLRQVLTAVAICAVAAGSLGWLLFPRVVERE